MKRMPVQRDTFGINKGQNKQYTLDKQILSRAHVHFQDLFPRHFQALYQCIFMYCNFMWHCIFTLNPVILKKKSFSYSHLSSIFQATISDMNDVPCAQIAFKCLYFRLHQSTHKGLAQNAYIKKKK